MAKIKKFSTKGKGMSNFSPVPTGLYRSKITKEEYKKNRNKTGSYLSLEWTVQKGKEKGSKFWSILNLEHENVQTVEIAQGELVTICKAVGFGEKIPSDTKQFKGKIADVEVEFEPEQLDKKGKVKAKARNNIKFYNPVGATGGSKTEESSDGAPWDDKKKKKKGKKKK